MRLLFAVTVLFASSWPPAEAGAHLGLDAPASRYGPDVLKTGPCGVEGGQRSDNVSYFEPGETIEVQWNEYIDHPGHYRIAFDADGDDDFVDPATMTELYSNDAVLLDGIPDQGRDTREYSATVTLPDVSCDHCTLQVIQVMYDKPPYTTPGNDIYYQCADLVLKVGGAPDGGVGSGGTGAADTGSTGCNASAHGGLSWVASLMILLAARRVARAARFPL